MSEKDLDGRVRDFVANFAAGKQSLLEEVEAAIAVRLVELFDGRATSGPAEDFEKWLCRQFEYDYHYAFNIFNEDAQLKSLVGYIDDIHGNMMGRRAAAQAVNERLRLSGLIHHYGVESYFTSTTKLS